MLTSRNAVTAVLAICMLALTCCVYVPGLSGGFLFDDFANLPTLGASGPVDTWSTFWRYITSGRADPVGRPLALLTFLVDAQNWPASPLSFKRTSLILHLINGVLLTLLLHRFGQVLIEPIRAFGISRSISDTPPIERSREMARRINMAAVLGGGLWLLHPLFVSTTMYIVQREAMLPATFTLLGLLSWLHGRTAVLQGRSLIGLIWIALGLGVCTVLAVLSKANGILLPALALVIEYTVMRHGHITASKALPAGEALAPTEKAHNKGTPEADRRHEIGARAPPTRSGNLLETKDKKSSRAYRWIMRVMAWAPATTVVIYLLYRLWAGLIHGVGRPWTLGQRLLTEPRILMDYLGLLWLPRPFTPGLFNDHIEVSTSLLSPVTTLPAIIAVFGLIIGTYMVRKRWPVMATAVLFYFVGQSLESSSIALELYFEHRNYLPAMLMFWPLALWLCGVRQRRSPDYAPARTIAAATKGPQGTRNGNPNERTSLAVDAILAIDESSKGTRASGAPASPIASADTWIWAKILLAVVLILGLATMTWARTDLWGNTRDQALLWAELNPGSPRAQANAAQAEMHSGRPDRAAMRLRKALIKAPDEAQLALNLFTAQCQIGHVDSATMQAVENALRTTRDPGTMLLTWFNRAISYIPDKQCPEATLATMHHLLDIVRENSRLDHAGRRQDFDYLEGTMALEQGNGNAALDSFNRALDQQVRVAAALKQAAQLGAAGFPRQGLAHLNHYASESDQEANPPFGMPRIHAWVLNRQQYWSKELARLRATLRDDARQQAATSE
jgi:hypothetical protein